MPPSKKRARATESESPSLAEDLLNKDSRSILETEEAVDAAKEAVAKLIEEDRAEVRRILHRYAETASALTDNMEAADEEGARKHGQKVIDLTKEILAKKTANVIGLKTNEDCANVVVGLMPPANSALMSAAVGKVVAESVNALQQFRQEVYKKRLCDLALSVVAKTLESAVACGQSRCYVGLDDVLGVFGLSDCFNVLQKRLKSAGYSVCLASFDRGIIVTF